ncbi:MAG: ATP-dependent Clp protease proteolytic subunit [Oscillospiraceae bacterium]|nr:ATP-dependent Clp protease proteolytic subunit [Oscillospiraceae bacterium]
MAIDINEQNLLQELGTAFPINGGIHCVSIIGQVEGHQILGEDSKTTKYEHLMPLLASMEETGDVGGVLFLINTAGGDVEAGLAIAELIAGMRKPTASIVLGGGHSIGVPLAVAAKRSFIVPSASMTVHPVRLSGTVIGTEQTYNYFARIQERIALFITSHSGISREKLLELMHGRRDMANDMGTVLSGKEAVEQGIIDAVGSLSDALDYLHECIDGKKERG